MANVSILTLILQYLKDLMEQQQQVFSDSTPSAGSARLQQLMSISQISTQKYGSDHFDPF